MLFSTNSLTEKIQFSYLLNLNGNKSNIKYGFECKGILNYLKDYK
ncbi:MAG: hypothetical protein ACI85O_000623 [Saprospiraceae bacterium]|jgi:hypothetical protein